MKVYNMNPLRVAFGGKAGSGKDMAVNHLISLRGGTNVKFSGPLYNIMFDTQSKLGFPLEKDRYFLQTVGTWARSKNPNIWVNLTKRNIESLEGNVFVSDVRFPNEFEMLKKKGFFMVKIYRNEIDEEASGHVSETSLDLIPESDWDHILHNNESIVSFYQKIHSILNLSLTQEEEQDLYEPVLAFGDLDLLRQSNFQPQE